MRASTSPVGGGTRAGGEGAHLKAPLVGGLQEGALLLAAGALQVVRLACLGLHLPLQLHPLLPLPYHGLPHQRVLVQLLALLCHRSSTTACLNVSGVRQIVRCTSIAEYAQILHVVCESIMIGSTLIHMAYSNRYAASAAAAWASHRTSSTSLNHTVLYLEFDGLAALGCLQHGQGLLHIPLLQLPLQALRLALQPAPRRRGRP